MYPEIFWADWYIHCTQSSIQNSPRQSANAKTFAKAYLHFIVYASIFKFIPSFHIFLTHYSSVLNRSSFLKLYYVMH